MKSQQRALFYAQLGDMQSNISVVSESRQLDFPDGEQALVVLWKRRLLDRR